MAEATGYSAGDLNLSIRTSAEDTLKYLDAVIERLNLISGGLGSIKSNAHITKTPRKSSGGGSGGLFGFAKLGASVYMLRRMGRYMANIVQAGSDYMETLNLWQVAMRNNLDAADEFINKMNKAYGISTKTLMQAQATFKNMIGSLGQISDATATKLSETLVQMSADFSSLYNVKLSSAFEKMQSMLAGQVRPIRSAGLDMTETTLYQYYQQLGGTKSMRQLNRTEKQLLSILAVYKQMGSAGALGDMSKTLNSFANQSRMMTEYWQELKAWSGLILKDWLDQNEVLIHINAALITMTEIMKAIAKSRGLGEENFIDGLFETTEATNDEIDELQGKLLDFDKFRSLEGAGQGELAIDQKLLDAITGYSSKIDEATNAAMELAETWLSVFGFTKDANGEFVIADGNLKNIEKALKLILIHIAVILSIGILAGLVKYGTFIKVYALVPLKNLGIAIWSNMVKPLIQYVTYLGKYYFTAFNKWLKTMELGKTAAIGFNAGLALLVANMALLAFGWDKMSGAEKVIGIFGAIGSAALVAAAAVAAFHGAWTMGTAVVAIVGGLAAITGAFTSFKAATKDLKFFANGASDIDGGTVFVAGEMGRTEMVYNGANGKSNVANIQQMRSAFKGALMDWTKEYLDEELNDISKSNAASSSVFGATLYSVVKSEARRRGEKFANV